MANESFANTLVVEVAGQPLPADVIALLTYAYVDDSQILPDLCVLRFRDPQQLVIAKGRFTVGVEVAVKVRTAEPGPPQPLMSGEVTAIEIDADRAGTFSGVRHCHKATRKRTRIDVIRSERFMTLSFASVFRNEFGMASRDKQLHRDSVA